MKWHTKILQKKELLQAEQELKVLEAEVIAAHNFLRENRNTYFNGKKKIPIYLLLGPSSFGKTTILAQAGLNLKNFSHKTLDNVTPTKYCSFWFATDALYIDTAGVYTKPEIVQPRNDLIWQGFVKLLQKYFGKNAISGALIILDLPAVSQDITLLKTTLFCIRERVYELSSFITYLPLYIIFTKCDRITGFVEFFSLLNTEERLQPFGIVFAKHQERVNPITVFDTKFNELLKYLNERVIERLQKSINSDERLLIKIFPSQLSQLNQTILEVLSKIPSGPQLLLSGIYFTSSIQNGAPVDVLKHALLHAFDLQEKQFYKLEASSNYSYFIEDLFKKEIITFKYPPLTKQWRLSKIKFHINYIYALLVTAIIVTTSSVIGYKSYHKNITTTYELKQLLQEHKLTNSLENIHQNLNKLDQTAKSWWLKLGINGSKPLFRKLHHTYQTLFLRTIVSQLERDISSSSDSAKLYEMLQIYLMFGEPEKLNKNYVKTWFNNYWSELYKGNNDQQIKLRQQLAITLQYPFRIELNQRIITAAREHLSTLPLTPLVYIMLENVYSNQTISVGSTKPIPKMYTIKYFDTIYHITIPKFIDDLPQHNWILGNQLQLQSKAKADNDMIKNIRELYIKKYVATWEIAANNPEIKIDSKNLHKIAKDLETLASKKSPFVKLIQQLRINTSIKNAPAAFTQAINEKLQSYIAINLDNLQRELINLAHNFDKVAQSANPNQIAFDIINNQLSDTSNQHPNFITNLQTFIINQPPQLQAWLQFIVKNSWLALLDGACNHINKVWHTTVVPAYKKMLEYKYPLFKDSKEDITLNDFSEFFGPHGIIDSFFNQYIRPLANIDQSNWSWKNIHGQPINFQQGSLEIFLRAALIQKMFYTNKTTTPKIYFTLAPMDIMPNTQSFSLHLDGQKIIFTNTNKQIYNLVWPGPNPGLVTIDFVNREGKYFSTSQFGPWAWFRIIDKSNLMPGQNTKHFTITFDLNGNAVKYELSTDELINPFIPKIINYFRCPDKLY